VSKTRSPKNDWHIWKADGKFLVLPSVEKPHDHIDPRVPAEVQATIYSRTEPEAKAVMNILSGKTPLAKEDDGIPD